MSFQFSNDCFRVLEGNHEQDRALWIEQWNSWPTREVQGHPSYMDRFCLPSQVPLAITYQSPEGGVLLPIVARSLSEEVWYSIDSPCWDLITPYGYGGPFSWGNVDAAAFWSELDNWAAAHNIVSLTSRLSLFQSQRLFFQGTVETPMLNVVCNLDCTEEELWSQYAAKVRKNVRKAERSGLRVIADQSGEKLEEFLEIYYATMKRREAGSGFYFPKEFFASICSELPGQFIFFHVLHENKVISTELVLCSQRTMYSFLGGTNSDMFSMRPNDLLKHEANRWGQKNGMHNFVLGGGYGYEDGIYKYKLAFAPKGSVPFQVGYHVFSPEQDARLTTMRAAYSTHKGETWQPREHFFPPYRS